MSRTNAFALGFGRTAKELTLDALPVRGGLPAWLEGTLVRNGPGTFQVGEQRYRHWFDGLAMLHRFAIAGGRVAYANRFLDTRSYREARDTGRISYAEFATDPCRSLFGRVTALFSPRITDSAKVSVARMADRFLALAETPIQVEFDPETLRTVGVFNYEDRLVGQMTTVHPQFDRGREQVYNVVTRYHRISHYRLYRMIGRHRPEMIGQVPVARPAYMHSFGMTPNYIVLSEFPLVVNPIHLLLWLRPYIENFRWEPERGTPFWVLNRHTGKVVARVDSEAFFAFHHVNAFERQGEIVLDIVAYPDNRIINAYYLHRLQDEDNELPHGNLRRYRIPLAGTTASYETLSDECMELPQFDSARFNTDGAYRYVYASSIHRERRQGFYNQIVKVDIESGQARTWHEPGAFPGEPIFVGAPGRTAEDDGVILSVVLDAVRGSSFLLVLDAQTFSERARAELPHPVLFGYHGAYFEGL